jgi:hypothetical protein
MSDRRFDVERFLADYAYLTEYLDIAEQKYLEGNRAIILMALQDGTPVSPAGSPPRTGPSLLKHPPAIRSANKRPGKPAQEPEREAI